MQPLNGFRDFYPQDYKIRDYLFSKWKELGRYFNLEFVDAPVLEPLDLFTEKSGPEIVKQLFHFEDQGKRKVALRPEMTPSLVRLVGSKINGLKKPVRWGSIVECFRYERPQKGRLRSFYQFNVDIVGESSLLVDAELMACLINALRLFGLGCSDFYIRLSDRCLWFYYLGTFGLNVEQSYQVLSIIDKLDGPLFKLKDQEALEPLLGEHLAEFIQKTQLFLCIKNYRQLEVFFNEHTSSELIEKRLIDIKSLLGFLASLQVDAYVQLDFSIVRGLAYYTGFVFEAFEKDNKGRALAGGGRYDSLLEKMGYPSSPAAGFAIGDVTLADLLKEKNLLPDFCQGLDVQVAYEDTTSLAAALRCVGFLRENKYSVAYSLQQATISKQIKKAYEAPSALFLICFKTALLAENKIELIHIPSKKVLIVSFDEIELVNYIENFLSSSRKLME